MLVPPELTILFLVQQKPNNIQTTVPQSKNFFALISFILNLLYDFRYGKHLVAYLLDLVRVFIFPNNLVDIASERIQ